MREYGVWESGPSIPDPSDISGKSGNLECEQAARLGGVTDRRSERQNHRQGKERSGGGEERAQADVAKGTRIAILSVNGKEKVTAIIDLDSRHGAPPAHSRGPTEQCATGNGALTTSAFLFLSPRCRSSTGESL